MSKKPIADDKVMALETPSPVSDTGVALYGRWCPPDLEGMSGVKHTLDLATERGKAMLVQAGSPADIEIKDGRARLTLCDAVFYWDTVENQETGETARCIRSVFFDLSGRHFRTTSPYAPHFFARCMDVYGRAAIQAGLRITVTERRSGNPKRGNYHDFRVEQPGYTPTDTTDAERDHPF